MEKILNDQGASKLYVAPDNQAIASIIVEMQRGAVNQTPGALQAWNKPVVVSAVENLSGELAVIGESFNCYHEKTHIYLPPNTKAVNLNIPRGNVCDVFAEFAPSAEFNMNYYTKSASAPLAMANGHTWEQYDSANGLTIAFWQWDGSEWIAKQFFDISSYSEKFTASADDKLLIQDASGETHHLLVETLLDTTPPTEKTSREDSDKVLLDGNKFITAANLLAGISAAANVGINPNAVTGRVRHHRAADIVANNNDILTSWPDISSFNTPAIAGGAPQYKTNSLNNRSSVWLNGSSGFKMPSIALGSFSIVMVMHLSSLEMLLEHSADLNSATGAFFIYKSNSSVAIKKGSGLLTANFFDGWLTGAPMIMTLRFKDRAFGASLRVNGFELFTQNVDNNIGSTAYTHDLFLGCRNLASLFCIGDIFETIVYNRYLSHQEIRGIEDYLANYYGLVS